MPIGAVIGAGASLGGAALQANAAKKAAKTQSKAANLARADLMPFTRAGTGAVASLAELYGIDPNTGERTGQPFPQSSLEAFRRSPDYEFARTEGLRGTEFSNAAKGALRSGNNLRDLTTFASGLATQNFGNYRGALERLASLGQNAAAGAGNAAMQAGAAQASGTVGAANAWNQGLGNIGNYAMLSSLMKPQGSAYGGGFGGGNNNLGYHMIPGFPGS